MHPSILSLVLILLFLILLSGFFSGSEIGMMSINRYRLKHLVKQKNKSAILVYRMLQKPDRLLSVILIGNTLANIVASTIATLLAQRLYGDAGVAVATILLTLIILVFSEMTPKTLAAMNPQKFAFLSCWPLRILQYIFTPFVFLISWVTQGVLKVFGVKMARSDIETLSGDELRTMVHEAGGFLPVEHKGMIIGLLDLEQATVEDIMVPKSDIVGIDLEQPWQELLEQLETAQHTRLPLYRDSIDNIVGMIHMRDVLHLVLEQELELQSLLDVAEAPYFIPEGTALNTQISQFQKMKRRSCFVVDEYGDIQGLVTLEDILEEVVGEFTTDFADFSRGVVIQEDGSVVFDASTTLRQIKRALGWKFPDIGPKTLSGLIIEYLGYIPPAECCLRIDTFQIEILKVGENRVQSVKIWKII